MGDIEITRPSKELGLSNDTVGWAKLHILFMLWSPEGIYGFLVRITCKNKKRLARFFVPRKHRMKTLSELATLFFGWQELPNDFTGTYSEYFFCY